jgi:hypothetical protein
MCFEMKKPRGWEIWLGGLFVVAIGLGLLVRSHDVGTTIGLGALGSALGGVLGGALLRRVWLALLLSAPGSLVYAVAYSFSFASHADKDWNDSDTGYLAGFTWFPAGLIAMFVGAIIGGFIGEALRRHSWKGDAALLEELRDAAERKARDRDEAARRGTA